MCVCVCVVGGGLKCTSVSVCLSVCLSVADMSRGQLTGVHLGTIDAVFAFICALFMCVCVCACEGECLAWCTS